MPSASTLAALLAASVTLMLLPGPAVLYLVATGVRSGARAGAVTALGVQTGTAVYVLATAAGLTALLVGSAAALSAVRYAGAAYLLWLGVRTLTRRDTADGTHEAAGTGPGAPPAARTLRGHWSSGFLVGITNPKIALFFLAFFPQFIRADAGSVTTQVLVLGAVFTAVGVVVDVGYGVAAGRVAQVVVRSGRARRRARVASGLTYLGLGGLAAASGQRVA